MHTDNKTQRRRFLFGGEEEAHTHTLKIQKSKN
jgi:hypothetical protein